MGMPFSQAVCNANPDMHASSSQGSTVPLKFPDPGAASLTPTGPKRHSLGCDSGVPFCQADSPEEPSQAPQDSGESEFPHPNWRGPRASRPPFTSLLGTPRAAARQGNAGAAGNMSSTAAGSLAQHVASGCLYPVSDGRTVVVSGFRKGIAGPEAQQQATEMCLQHGHVKAFWFRRGRGSCYVIAQFAEVISVSCRHNSVFGAFFCFSSGLFLSRMERDCFM